MSANNFIRILKQKDGNFEVTERDQDTGGLIDIIGKFPIAEFALDAARLHNLDSEMGVEGGIEYVIDK